MKQNILFPLSNYGYSKKYFINKQGQIIDTKQHRILNQESKHNIKIKDSKGRYTNISTKVIYRKVFNKEYCIDNIKVLDGEEWKEIKGTNGRYFISSYGRVKSLCGYNAIIMQVYYNNKGYKRVCINGRDTLIHLLVADNFLKQNCRTDNKIEVHHIDGNKLNNKKDNLMYVDCKEHIEIHKILRKIERQQGFK